MIRKYSIGDEVSTEKRPIQKVYLKKSGYDIAPVVQTPTLYKDSRVKRVLPAALDVFSDLPSFVYDNDHAKAFLECLRKHIIDYNPMETEGIVLSKLQVSESTEKILIIEWIYNYFRFYYAFDKIDGDYRGVVMNDPDDDRFTNDVQKMKPQDYDALAEADLTYVIMMTEGVTDGISD